MMQNTREIKRVKFARGATIWVQDSPTHDTFCILESGTVKIVTDLNFEDRRLNTYQAGDTFGIVSGLTGNLHRSTLIAETDCNVIKVPLGMLGNYARQNRDVTLKIISLWTKQRRLFQAEISCPTLSTIFVGFVFKPATSSWRVSPLSTRMKSQPMRPAISMSV